MLTPDFIIGTHDAPYMTLHDGSLKSGKIDFLQSTIAKFHIDVPAPQFLIVERVMFHTSSNAIFLYALNIRYYHNRSQIRILTHVFKVTTVERCAIDIHTRSQQYILFPVTCFLANGFSVKC